MTADGTLLIGAFFNLHLWRSKLLDIKEALYEAWMEHVSVQVTNRKFCRNFPVIDRRATIAFFQKQEGQAKHALSLQMIGGWMTQHQKTHFVDIEDKCIFCDKPDSQYRQLLECEATAMTRDRHRDTCNHLEEGALVSVIHPVAFRTPWFDMLRTLQFQLPEPQLTEPAQTAICLFTDGSTLNGNKKFPQSAYAIVAPKVSVECILAHSHFSVNDHVEHHFDVLGVAHVTGKQSNNRAELFAVVVAHEKQTQLPVVTDSGYVLSMHALLRATPALHMLHKRANWDLLQRWHVLIWDKQLNTPTVKVAAHQELLALRGMDLFHAIGNGVADVAAKRACTQLHVDYLDMRTAAV